MTPSEAGKLGYLKSKHLLNKRHTDFRLQWERDPKQCLYCNKDLSYKKRNNKYCNHSCAASKTNQETTKNKQYNCKWCNSLLKTNKKYCNRQCQTEYRYSKIDNGEIELLTNNTARKYLVNRRGHFCEICGIKTWLDKPILLIVDHIDGNSQNNQVDNLRLICSNCDATLPTYKSKNLGSGRHFRKIRYKNGQSY